MKKSIDLKKPANPLQKAKNWLLDTPERALNEAYEAAIAVRRIERENFDGDRISPASNRHGEQTYAYFETELKKYLFAARTRLREFRFSLTVITLAPGRQLVDFGPARDAGAANGNGDRPLTFLERLAFVDELLEDYRQRTPAGSVAAPERSPTASPASDSAPLTVLPPLAGRSRNGSANFAKPAPVPPKRSQRKRERREGLEKEQTIVGQTSFMPRSILRSISRIKQQLDPKAETQVVEDFRLSQSRTIVSLKFVILLVLVPLLVHQASKNFIVDPILQRTYAGEEMQIFLNVDMEEEAFQEVEHEKDFWRFEKLIGRSPDLSEEQIEEKARKRALELAEEYKKESVNAIKNVFGDLFAVVALVVVILCSKREIGVLKSFLDDVIYGLSDSAKAFIIILLTDTFVGFHSPHGWEVILEGISRHLGLPENREFNFLFIATFPVILDTVFKYWIFRYLNRISPSAVATYRNMNE